MKAWRRSKRQKPSRQPNLPGLFAPATKSRRLATQQEQAVETARSRLLALSLLFVAAYIVIGGRLTFLTLLSDTPETPMTRQDISESVASRADITDRNGTVLATSLPTVSLCADAKKITN